MKQTVVSGVKKFWGWKGWNCGGSFNFGVEKCLMKWLNFMKVKMSKGRVINVMIFNCRTSKRKREMKYRKTLVQKIEKENHLV